jgi:hypothetical protein
MEYNTQQRKLPLPEYGRSVQNMVDHALTIEDRAERQRCANAIINIMGGMFPHLRDVPDFKHKLWDHLAIMSDFKLDIDYPYEVVNKENLEVKPDRIPYSEGKIKLRHYGMLLPSMIKKAAEYPEVPEKKQLISLLANQMKKSFTNWNKDGIDDAKLLADLREFSNGVINISPEDLHISEQRVQFNQRKPRTNYNQRRKY